MITDDGNVLDIKYSTTMNSCLLTTSNINYKGLIYWMKDNKTNNEAPFDFYSISYDNTYAFDEYSFNNKIISNIANNKIDFQFVTFTKSSYNNIYTTSKESSSPQITIDTSNYCNIYECVSNVSIVNSTYVDINKHCSGITVNKLYNCVVRANNKNLLIKPSGTTTAYNITVEEGSNVAVAIQTIAVNNTDGSFQTVIRSNRTMEILI
jgi:hypothetical protein